MTELRIEEFQPNHIRNDFVLRPGDKGRVTSTDFEKFIEGIKGSPAHTFFYKDKVIFCAGVKIYFPGFGEAWILCSERVGNFKKQLVVCSKIYLKNIINDYGLYCVQATVRCDWKQAQKFVEKLGFEKEGLHKRNNDHTEYFVYGRVR